MIHRTNLKFSRALSLFAFSLLLSGMLPAPAQWQQPTQEELKMTSLPELPGAAAVVLYHEELIDDGNQTWSYYFRIKILTAQGRDDFSSIPIQYPQRSESSAGYNIDTIAGRTIHSDGKVIPFTGKPFDRLLEKGSSLSVREKVIALPDIQVGSIVEYRYTLRQPFSFGGKYTFIPTWFTQSAHFERKEHFLWQTEITPIAWTSTLPSGSPTVQSKGTDFTLDVSNVMPIPDEPHMLPEAYFVQKVSFYQVFGVRSKEDFWDQRGKDWSKDIDDFIGSPSRLSGPLAQIVGGATSQEDKLRRIYAAVQQMRNTNFSRQHSEREEKADHENPPKSVVDVFTHKHGNDLELTYLFVALARAAGMKAYVMAVTNRDLNTFNLNLLSFSQLNDDIAIVEIDGHELFFDPAEPFCPYGQLLWPHTNAKGIRQTATGTAFATSRRADFKETQALRAATLTLGRDGHESGSVDLAFTGARAIAWRQLTLLDDEEALHKDLESYLNKILPPGSEATLRSVENLRDENQPLLVHFDISGPWASVVGKRLVLPSQFFQINQQQLFPSPTRQTPVYFPFPERILDNITLHLPAGSQVESHPALLTESMPNVALYQSTTALKAGDLILQRDYAFGGVVIPANLYADLRGFLARVAERDKAPVILRTDSGATGGQ